MTYKIYNNGERVNIIVANEEFVTSYCLENGYTFEEETRINPEPEAEIDPLDKLRSDLDYTMMMTGVI